MTTLASASLSRENQEHRMVVPLTVSLGLSLATLTCSHLHHDSDTRCSPRARDPALTSQGYPCDVRARSWALGLQRAIESPFGSKASTHTFMSR